ncbi:maleylpyruvate isomerase family mycothiol-dependent enzyme [Gordonia sp. OPL2]|uniref:maleylpyruvate isomerase family mycothiol-dependent enzyme n=1 Tax=Gordonia sp. OPL2 TaxID=2486274 RepID=UPI001655C768|nr:maleylpyruvate isomerase family mycothiol-dependent enzyme [Gordonia sp. OPL2]RPA12803.1 maleylpyruvate isomerase family mycothiol-dependent enzyme [Gordonia sp. OPL2]
MPTTILPIDTVVTALTDEWTVLDDLVTSVTDEQWQAASVLPGWTVADIIAHVIGTESMLDGRAVDSTTDVASLDHVHNPIGEFNEHWIEQFRGSSRAEVMAALREIVDVRAGSLRSMTQADFDAEAATPAGPDTYGRFMRIRVFDCWIHEIDIRDSTDGSTPSQPGSAEIALSEIAASLPFVIAKKARTPQGTTVLLRIGGIAARDIRIVVEERARLVDELPGGDDSADVVLTMDVVDLARLVGGRSSAEPSRVVVDGHQALGQAIVENLAYVI